MGLIDVEMPRTRQGGSPVDVIGLDGMIAQAYVKGCPPAAWDAFAESLLRNPVSRSTVSRVTKTLEQQIEELRSKPLSEPFPYLYIDATFLDARWPRSVENVRLSSPPASISAAIDACSASRSKLRSRRTD